MASYRKIIKSLLLVSKFAITASLKPNLRRRTELLLGADTNGEKQPVTEDRPVELDPDGQTSIGRARRSRKRRITADASQKPYQQSRTGLSYRSPCRSHR